MELRGVRVHNLKNLDLDIPLNCLVVVSGVSGSGKSSLAFDTLFAEGQRRYIESFSVSARQHLERIDRPDADRISHIPPAISVRSERNRRNRNDSRSTTASVADLLDGLRLLFTRIGRIFCPKCRTEVRSRTSSDVVHTVQTLPMGTRCQLGFVARRPTESVDPVALWRARGFSRAIWKGTTHDLGTKPNWPTAEDVWLIVDRMVVGKTSPERIAESADVAFSEGGGRCGLWIEAGDSPPEAAHIVDGRHWLRTLFNRSLVCTTCHQEFLPVEPRLLSHFASGACLACGGTGRNSKNALDGLTCVACLGTRFRDEARAVLLANQSIADLCAQTPPKVLVMLEELVATLTPGELQLTELVRADVQHRLRVVCELGLGYLTLDRAADTLSGGEARRLMLAALLGSRINGTLVVVDEPSAGLSSAELPQVIEALRRIQGLRNSVIAVDHSPIVVSSADYVIELGPGAGPSGGRIVYQGSPATRIEPSSDQQANPCQQRAPASQSPRWIELTNVHHHNLRDFQTRFLCGGLNVVAGPSGSGKTSLVTQVLFPTFCQRLRLSCTPELPSRGTCDLAGGEGIVDAILIDQSPLAKSSRSNPATWLEVFDEIRQTFAATQDAKQRGFTAQHFSFNSAAGGRCRSCQGTGHLKHDMQFLPDVTLDCPECRGTRYRREILDVKYRGRSIADVLAMSVSEAAVFFRSQARVQYRFQLLKQIGLDYLVLGQPSETLSGGEAQRLKLAARLGMPNRGPCLIVCDEPTTGLHPTDVGRLISCFQELIANGHTLVLADNSSELLAVADCWIDLASNAPVRPARAKVTPSRSA